MKGLRLILAALLVTAAVNIPLPAAGASPAWEWRNPVPTGLSFQQTVFGNGLFVAVTLPEGMATSEDGIHWQIGSGGPEAPRSLTFGAGRFAVISGNRVFTSANGVHWTPQQLSGNLSDLTYGNGRFVALSDRGIFTSEDGTAWSQVVTGGTWYDLHFGRGAFVALNGAGMLAVSNDGLEWTDVMLAQQVNRLGFDGRRFVALTVHRDLDWKGIPWGSYLPGPVYTSPDGRVWGPAEEPVSMLSQVACSEDVCAGLKRNQNTLVFARGNQPWEFAFSAAAPLELSALTYGNGIFLATGPHGLLLTSTDGHTWVSRSASVTYDNLTDISFAEGVFVAVGPDALLLSQNGKDWRRPPEAQGYSPTDLAYGNGRFIAVGGSEVLISLNGLAWEVHRQPLGQVVFAGHQFVALDAEGRTWTTETGFDWQQQSDEGIRGAGSLAYGGGRFLFLKGGYLYRSDDGSTWFDAPGGRRESATGPWRHLPSGGKLIYAAGFFWAPTSAGVYRSQDGARWEQVLAGHYTAVACSRGRLVAVGPGHVAMSDGGRRWVESPFPVSGMSRIAEGNGTWVAVGANGRILTLDWPWRTTGAGLRTLR